MNIAIYTFNSRTDTLPTFNDGFTYTYTDVNNGDDTITRTITSDSSPTSISFSSKQSLVSVSYLDISNVTTMSCMFQHCSSLTSIELSNWNTSNVTDMGYMFQNCYKLTSIDVSNWNTSNVIRMSNMFLNCNRLTSIDVSNFDTRKVTDMYGMFSYCMSLTSLDISNFDTNNVKNIGSMFSRCNALTTLDLSSFNTSKVYDMSSMFSGCSKLTSIDLSSFNTSKVTDMSGMFNNCSNLVSVDMDSSDIDSINDIIAQLPTRTADSPGTLKTGAIPASSVDIDTANNKYWNIVDTAKYSFTLDTLKHLLTNIKNKFITKEEMNNKVDKVNGKQLSSNNFSDEDVNNINNSFDDTELNQNRTTISFYSTSLDGTKTKIKDIDLDI